MTLPRVHDPQRRARLALRHRLTPGAGAIDPVDATRSVVALHASDPTTVYLSLWARGAAVTPETVEGALYEDRSLVRMLGMRRTLHVVPRDLVGTVQRAAADPVAVRERQRLASLVEAADVTQDIESWLRELEASALEIIGRRGEAFAADLGLDDPRLRTKLTLSQGRRWEAQVSVSTRILLLLGAEGRIVRGRPRGTWISSQYRWSTTERWLGAAIEPLDPRRARAEIIRRWLAAFGPGTLEDLRWWTGWTLRDVRASLADIGAVRVALETGEGFVLAGDEAPVTEPEPGINLLPGLDPTTMGWTERAWYLGSHRPQLFDSNGNAGPTIWWGGRVIGGWAQRPDGSIATGLLEDVGRSAAIAVDEASDRLAAWLGPIRFVPRFRTPLERELSS
jgi:hypothetical protein